MSKFWEGQWIDYVNGRETQSDELTRLREESLKRSKEMKELTEFVRASVKGKIANLEAENAAIRAALKPILERIEMPRNGCSHSQYVFVQASELEALAAALEGEEKQA